MIVARPPNPHGESLRHAGDPCCDNHTIQTSNDDNSGACQGCGCVSFLLVRCGDDFSAPSDCSFNHVDSCFSVYNHMCTHSCQVNLLSHCFIPFWFCRFSFPLSDLIIAWPGQHVKHFFIKKKRFLKSLLFGISPIKIGFHGRNTAEIIFARPITFRLAIVPRSKQVHANAHSNNKKHQPAHRIVVNHHFLLSPFVF